jgi:hypothetical protein
VAVVPGCALLELPGDGHAVLRHATVFKAGDLGSEDRDQVSVRAPARQGFVEDTGGVLVFGSDSEMGVQQRGGLPPEQPERAATAAFGGGVGRGGGGGDARGGQELRGERGGQAKREHAADEAATGQSAATDVFNRDAELVFVHGGFPVSVGVSQAAADPSATAS